MNHLLELITRENLIYNFQASNKTEVIEKLVKHASKIYNFLPEQEREISTALFNREKTMSTGIGSGVAIPHCSVGVVEDIKSVVALSKEGIDFEAIDNLPVHIFILLVVPKSKFQEHIKTLALIAKTLNVKEEREKFIQSNSYEDLMKVFGIQV
ncbi:MAG: PTS sugar transporter subunit IIA [Leptospiraceae bacterium]|nr:PTS sugar transporter subunit IIA [Leptospiraceae bacterium]